LTKKSKKHADDYIKDLYVDPGYIERKFSQNKYDHSYVCMNLQKDLLDYQQYIKLEIKKLKGVQTELLELLHTAVEESIPEFELKIFGSHATNLCLPWSDLDLVLIPKNSYSMATRSNIQYLQTLYYNLLEKDWEKTIKFIDTAVIPIIKLTTIDELNSIQIDLSIQDSKHFGIKCVDLVKLFLNDYIVLEPLVFALKNILKNANLNDPYTGGLSSYGLILMIISFLQREMEKGSSINLSDVGSLLVKFLFYYGCEFEPSSDIIYAYIHFEQGPVEREALTTFFNETQSNHDLIIVDPLNKANNVGKSSYQFSKIKMAFMIAYIVSHEECECSCHYNDNDDHADVDHCLLKRIFTSIKRFNS